MSVQISGVPAQIYLVFEFAEEGDSFGDFPEVSWCGDRICENDVEFFRGDLFAAQAAEIARLRATMQMVLDANPREWQELAERPSEFERWAKSRLNHALLPQQATHAD